jgi:hypothetical protein
MAVPAQSTFVWGLQRSGIHLVVSWLFANFGGRRREPLPATGHPQFGDGFLDPVAQVAFFNNPGRFYCRAFKLGPIQPHDVRAVADEYEHCIVSIEDCSLACAAQLPAGDRTASLLVVRHPLNLLASRRRGATTRPELFRTDVEFIEILAAHYEEALEHTDHLPNCTVVVFDRFVDDPSYRDALAARLEVPNRDAVTEVSSYGGGSSFTGAAGPTAMDALHTRYLEEPLPATLVHELVDRPAIVDACRNLFGFELRSDLKTA